MAAAAPPNPEKPAKAAKPVRPPRDGLAWLIELLGERLPQLPAVLNPTKYSLNSTKLFQWLQRAHVEHGQAEAEFAKLESAAISRSTYSGLQFSVDLVARDLRRFGYPLVTPGAAVYTAAVIEYLAAEVLELSGNKCRDQGLKREYAAGVIQPRDIISAIVDDEELALLLRRLEKFPDFASYGFIAPTSGPAPDSLLLSPAQLAENGKEKEKEPEDFLPAGKKNKKKQKKQPPPKPPAVESKNADYPVCVYGADALVVEENLQLVYDATRMAAQKAEWNRITAAKRAAEAKDAKDSKSSPLAAAFGSGGGAEPISNRLLPGAEFCASILKLVEEGEKDDPADDTERPEPTELAKYPLHVACALGDAKLVASILDRKTSAYPLIDSYDADGVTPLITAVMHGRLEVVKLLLARGADITRPFSVVDGYWDKQQRETWNAVDEAMRIGPSGEGSFELVDTLLRSGATVSPSLVPFSVRRPFLRVYLTQALTLVDLAEIALSWLKGDGQEDEKAAGYYDRRILHPRLSDGASGGGHHNRRYTLMKFWGYHHDALITGQRMPKEWKGWSDEEHDDDVEDHLRFDSESQPHPKLHMSDSSWFSTGDDEQDEVGYAHNYDDEHPPSPPDDWGWYESEDYGDEDSGDE